MSAVWGEHLEITMLLVSKGADLNIQDNEGSTPLTIASYKGELEIVKLLISKGADINIQETNGQTALRRSLVNIGRYVGVTKYLVEKGADLNIQDAEGDTVSIFVSEYGSIEALKIFVENGADLTLKNNKGQTALGVAKANKNTEVVKYLESL